MFVNQENKEIIKKYIKEIYYNERTSTFDKIIKIFGNRTATKIDEEIFMYYYKDTMNNNLKRTRYIDVLELISDKYNIIFDVEVEDLTDCFFCNNGSIFEKEDTKLIYE